MGIFCGDFGIPYALGAHGPALTIKQTVRQTILSSGANILFVFQHGVTIIKIMISTPLWRLAGYFKVQQDEFGADVVQVEQSVWRLAGCYHAFSKRWPTQIAKTKEKMTCSLLLVPLTACRAVGAAT